MSCTAVYIAEAGTVTNRYYQTWTFSSSRLSVPDMMLQFGKAFPPGRGFFDVRHAGARWVREGDVYLPNKSKTAYSMRARGVAPKALEGVTVDAVVSPSSLASAPGAVMRVRITQYQSQVPFIRISPALRFHLQDLESAVRLADPSVAVSYDDV